MYTPDASAKPRSTARTGRSRALFEPLENRLLLAADPTFLWAEDLGAQTLPLATHMDTDADGNIYVARGYQGKTAFTVSVAKYGASGKLRWRRAVVGPNTEDIAVDDDGTVAVTGSFQGTVDFDPGPGKSLLKSVGQNDGYVLKLNRAGRFLWARQFGGGKADEGRNVGIHNGQVYVSGLLTGAGRSGLRVGGTDGFIGKYDANGNMRWAVRAAAPESPCPSEFIVDAAGNVLATGNFHGSVDFDPGKRNIILTSGDGMDLFIWKLNADGKYVWATHWGSGNINARAITADVKGNIYVTGSFNSELDFVTPKKTYHLSPPNGDTIFLARFSPKGQPVYARATTTENNLVGGMGNAISTDLAGNVYLTGRGDGYWISGTTIIQKFAPGGTSLWSQHIEGASIGADIAAVRGRYVYVLGTYSGTADLDPTAGVASMTAKKDHDTYLLRLRFPATAGTT